MFLNCSFIFVLGAKWWMSTSVLPLSLLFSFWLCPFWSLSNILHFYFIDYIFISKTLDWISRDIILLLSGFISHCSVLLTMISKSFAGFSKINQSVSLYSDHLFICFLLILFGLSSLASDFFNEFGHFSS